MKINCENCGKEFDRKPSQIKLAKHHTCSTKCQHELRGKLAGKTTKCKFCKKPLKKSSEENTFCNNVCKDNHEKYTNTKTTNGFMENKYTKLYFKIVENRKNNHLDGYTENHHILPDSMGGSSDKSNMIRLSAREHFICHFLLTKMTVPYSVNWAKMQKAFTMMNATSKDHKNERYMNSTLYESQRINFSKVMSKAQMGKNNSQYGTRWINKDSINKKINVNELAIFIADGWNEGKHKKLKSYNKICHYCNTNFLSNRLDGQCCKECAKASKVFVSNIKTRDCIKILVSDVEKYLSNGYIKKRIKDFDNVADYGKKPKRTMDEIKLIKKEKAKTLFLKFANGNYNTMTEFAVDINNGNKSVVAFRYLWKQHINGFNELLISRRNKGAISSELVKKLLK